MNKVIKGLFATAALASLIGTVQVNAQEVDLEKLTDISAHTEGDTKVYDSLYIFGQNVHKSYITAFDISEAVLNNVKKDPNIYYKAPTGTAESTLVSLNHPDTQIDKTKKFEMVRLIGALDGDHVSQDTSLYTEGYYIGLEDTTYYGTRKSEIFATNKAEQPTATFTELENNVDELLGFKKEEAYGKEEPYKFAATPQADGTIKLTGLVKHQDLYYNGKDAETVNGHYIAYKLEIPKPEDLDETKAVIRLNNGKEISLEQFDGYVLVKLDENSSNKTYKVTVDLDGDGEAYAPTEMIIDWSDLKFEQVSTAEVVANSTMSSEWEFDSKLGTIEVTKSEDTYNLSGRIFKQSVNGYAAEKTEGFYFTFGVNIGTNDDTTIEVKNNADKTQFKKTVAELKAMDTYNDYDVENGILGVIWKANPDATTKQFKVIVDLDGDGELYTPVTYIIDYSQVLFGEQSPAEILDAAQSTTANKFLNEAFSWTKPEDYTATLKVSEKDDHTFIATGFIPKINKLSQVGFTDDDGYYLAYTILADHNFSKDTNVPEALKALTVTIKTQETKTITYDKFDSDTMLYMLQALHPEDTPVDKRKFTIEIDYDGPSKHEYAPEVYTIDWSQLVFGDTASAKLSNDVTEFADELAGYGYTEPEKLTFTNETPSDSFAAKYTVKGDFYEQTIDSKLGFDESEKFFLAFIVSPEIATNVNPSLTELPAGTKITIANGVGSNGEDSEHTATTSVVSIDTLKKQGNKDVILIHLNKDTSKRYALVTVDFGDGYTLGKYLIDYSGVTLHGTTTTKVENISKEVAESFKNGFKGYDYETAGKIDIVETKDTTGKTVYKAKGYANKQNVDYYNGPHDTYSVPFSVKVSNPQDIEKITLQDTTAENTKVEYTREKNSEEFAEVDNTGYINMLQEVSTDGTNLKYKMIKMTIKYKNDGVTYTDQELYFDFSEVKFGALGEFITAYRNTEVKGLTVSDNTTITTNSSTLTSEIQNKINWFKVITDETVKDVTECKAQTEGKRCLNISFLASELKSILTSVLPRYSNGVTFDKDLFNKKTTFTVVLNNGLIESIKGDFKSGTGIAKGKHVSYGDGSKAEVKELKVDYVITDYVDKTEDEVVYTPSENKTALNSLNTAFNNTKTNNNDGNVQNIELKDLTETEFNQLYTKIARVANTKEATITINDTTYDDNTDNKVLRQTGIGNNVFLYLPVFYVLDDVLYVSTTELTATAIKDGDSKISVAYAGCDYEVDTGLTPADGNLTIKDPNADIKAVFTQDGYENILVTTDENGVYTVKLTSSHGKHLIAIKLYDNNELVKDGKIYIYDDKGNVYFDTIAGKIENDEYTYGTYLSYNAGKAYKEATTEPIKTTQTIYIEGHGSITINFELTKTVKGNE